MPARRAAQPSTLTDSGAYRTPWRSTFPPSSARSATAGSTGGCSTTSTARTPSPPASSGVDRGAHLTTRRWYYLIPRDGEPRALVHAIERHNLDAAAGPETGLRPPRSARGGAHGPAARGHDAWRWSTPPAAPSPMSRGSTPARPKRSAPAAWTSSRRAISSRRSRRCGRRPSSRRTASRRRRSTGSRTGRSRPPRPPSASGRALDEYELAAADGGLVRRGRAGVGLGAGGRRRARTPATRTTSPPPRARRPSSPTSCCCSTSGASWHSRAPSLPTSRGSAITGRTVPRENGRGVRRRRPRARRRGGPGAGRGQGRARTAGVGSGPRGPDGAGRRGVRGAGLAPHRPQPGRRASTATVRTSTTSRPTTSAGCCPGTGFTVEPGVYLDEFGVRTEINVFRGDREAGVTGPRQDAIVPLLS